MELAVPDDRLTRLRTRRMLTVGKLKDSTIVLTIITVFVAMMWLSVKVL